jgi:thiamine biosynthesis lipoprotein
MGTFAHVVVVGGPRHLVAEARRRIASLETRWSRFLPESEVSELNRRAGEPVAVSEETRLLVELAVEGWRLSGGAFDPTVLGAVIRSGYDRSFERLGANPRSGTSELDLGAAAIEVGPGSVRLPVGSGFDPGGVGKGLAADLVCGEILDAGAEGVCVNLGGDVRVAGLAPEGEGWTIAVEHDWATEPLAVLGMADGAVATSTTLRRRWQSPDGQSRHHLIDPHTGLPSETDVNSATVVAACAWAAEALAKAVLLRGSSAPFDILGGTGGDAFVVTDDGRITATDGFSAYLGAGSLPASVAAMGRPALVAQGAVSVRL